MKISVIIPVYNAAGFVDKAVKSALYHKEVNEVLLVEDGSTDSSLEKCKELASLYPAVKLFQHKNGVNKGAGASRNLGILNATQVYVSFLDADDFYTAIRFNKEKKIFKDNPKCDGVYGAIGVKYIDNSGAAAWESKGFDEQSLTTVNKPIPPDNLFEFFIGIKNEDNYKGYFSLDGLTLKRKALLDSKIMFDESLRLHQDTVFIWQLAFKIKLFTGEYKHPIAIRGVHADNRFIYKSNLSVSRSKQYKSLRTWSIKEGLKNEVIQVFHKKFFKNYLYAKPNTIRIMCYVNLLMTDSLVRKNFNKKQLKLVWKSIFYKV